MHPDGGFQPRPTVRGDGGQQGGFSDLEPVRAMKTPPGPDVPQIRIRTAVIRLQKPVKMGLGASRLGLMAEKGGSKGHQMDFGRGRGMMEIGGTEPDRPTSYDAPKRGSVSTDPINRSQTRMVHPRPNRLRRLPLIVMVTASVLLPVAGCESTPNAPTNLLLEKGNHDFEWGRYEQAAEHYGDILDREPGDPKALEGYGRCMLALGRPADAAESFSLAVARRPGDRDLLVLLAEAEFEAGDLDEAFDLVRTWALDNNDAVAWYKLADFARRSNDPDTARDSIIRAIEIDPDGSASYYLLAAEIDMDLLQNTTSALRRLRQAYGLEPGNQEISDRIRAYGEIPGPTLVLPPGP